MERLTGVTSFPPNSDDGDKDDDKEEDDVDEVEEDPSLGAAVAWCVMLMFTQ